LVDIAYTYRLAGNCNGAERSNWTWVSPDGPLDIPRNADEDPGIERLCRIGSYSNGSQLCTYQVAGLLSEQFEERTNVEPRLRFFGEQPGDDGRDARQVSGQLGGCPDGAV
jgi:hypothetical protein